ncbi:DNA replication initiation control protein YabA [Pseudalkalibacillus caeni]|uniref:DNA replication initiation control protein YabA n=1 Tax=Exobacillus caeni TaxID=2574798 RepID=A0A5R9F7Y8_9BACL|nr:DNA replication initiation control protein YabA [Pseudalkalibacillus caeni]TLS35855.1 DNA replication initiation control protein YabA [Pseudalkalibacillus caeni]
MEIDRDKLQEQVKKLTENNSSIDMNGLFKIASNLLKDEKIRNTVTGISSQLNHSNTSSNKEVKENGNKILDSMQQHSEEMNKQMAELKEELAELKIQNSELKQQVKEFAEKKKKWWN